ncbi:MAG: hypothetical protein N0C82_13725 [Candidatus Thiodiazotropha endolucinida]|nr:hypothetical protein [Candidatus Thiodiazotropha taylori]MCW4296364.1 hypothetical protein [Candidatus Thiodiazotropha endolucinida]
MARPGIPESAYREAFDRLVAEGRRVEDINANMLQQAVGGGRYGRAADFLEQFRDEYRQQQAQAERLPDKVGRFAATFSSYSLQFWVFFLVAAELPFSIKRFPAGLALPALPAFLMGFLVAAE